MSNFFFFPNFSRPRARAGRLVLASTLAWFSVSLAASGPIQSNPELWPELTSPVRLDADIEKRVDDLMARMSIEHKVGQMIQAEIQFVTPEDVRKYHLGSILNGGGSFPDKNKYASPGDWLALADAFYQASVDTSQGGLGIPLIWGTDAVHGHSNVYGATIFPHNIGLGATRNPELIRQIGAATAIEVAVTGIPWTFAPTLAVVRDDRWGRTYEGYSEDPEVVRAYAGEMVLGLQGEPGSDGFLGDGRVLATAKHFLGDGGTENGQDQGNNLASEEDLVGIHAQGYLTALGAGVQTVMASFNSWHGVKMHGNRELLTTALKERMGFDGFVVGDWNGHGQIPGCSNSSCPDAINAGVDMFMVPEDWKAIWRNTLKQVKKGKIPMSRVDDAVRRILRVKIRMGLFEKGAPSTWAYAAQTEFLGAPEHRAIARQAVRESLVLLKNNGGLLPLDPSTTVLVAGRGADSIEMQTGGWTLSWQGTGNKNSDFPGATSILAGIEDAVAAGGGKTIFSVDGYYPEKPDVAVVVFGESPYAEFQGDLRYLQFQPSDPRDLALLVRLRDQGIPVVSVFLSGRPLWVNSHLNQSDAFVAAWLPGSEGGGVADVLFRKADGAVNYDFKGKLSFSWPVSADQFRLNVGSPDYQPLFAYGYGLTYADSTELTDELPVEAAGSGAANVPDLEVFAMRMHAPWVLKTAAVGRDLAGLDGSRLVAIDNFQDPGEGLPSAMQTDRNVQNDALRFRWLPDKPGMIGFMLDSTGPAGGLEPGKVDASRYGDSGGVLRFDVQLRSEKLGELKLGMGSSGGRWVEQDLGRYFEPGDSGKWKLFNFALDCFEQQGLDMASLTSPFYLRSDSALEVVVSNISIIAGPGVPTNTSCDAGTAE
jgi:beta-glucosidase